MPYTLDASHLNLHYKKDIWRDGKTEKGGLDKVYLIIEQNLIFEGKIQ